MKSLQTPATKPAFVHFNPEVQIRLLVKVMWNCISTVFATIVALSTFAVAAENQSANSGDGQVDAAFEVLEVEATNKVRYHGVDSQSVTEDKKQFVQLSGPTHFSRAMAFEAQQPAFLSWYSIRKPAGDTQTLKFSIAKPNQTIELQIEEAEYVLCPSKELQDGRPAEVPERLSYLKAFKIKDAPRVETKVQLSGAAGPKSRQVAKPTHVCIPMQQWHHDEHFVVTDEKTCYLIFSVEPAKASMEMAAIDQFGLHGLDVKKSSMVMLPVKLLE